MQAQSVHSISFKCHAEGLGTKLADFWFLHFRIFASPGWRRPIRTTGREISQIPGRVPRCSIWRLCTFGGCSGPSQVSYFSCWAHSVRHKSTRSQDRTATHSAPTSVTASVVFSNWAIARISAARNVFSALVWSEERGPCTWAWLCERACSLDLIVLLSF